MSDNVHLIVAAGPDKGMEIRVPDQGARLGRSSKNDIVLSDPLLSRHHCRIFFKPGEGIWITDLGSANGTIVNGAEIQESRLNVGSMVTIGDTTLKVISDRMITDAPPKPTHGPHIDLGLNSDAAKPQRKKIGMGPIITVGVIFILVGVVYYTPKLLDIIHKEDNITKPAPKQDITLSVYYEKIEADLENIFRYELSIMESTRISVRVDNTSNRHIMPPEKTLSKEYADNLVNIITNSGFFDLDTEYTGMQPDSIDQMVLSITVGNRTHQVTVRNRVEPDAFKAVREQLEECGINEFKLQPVQFSPEKLTEMARDALIQSKNLHAERHIAYGNLSDAIKNLTLAKWYLDSVEPKPAFYPEILSLTETCEKDLTKQYDDLYFAANKAKNIESWSDAERALTIILNMIPDKSDPRHQKVEKELLDVQFRMNVNK